MSLSLHIEQRETAVWITKLFPKLLAKLELVGCPSHFVTDWR
jgi:hypothetical protein